MLRSADIHVRKRLTLAGMPLGDHFPQSFVQNCMNYEYVEKPEQLRELIDRLRSVPLLGVDTEAAGYHRYLDKLSLVQISSRDANFLIDPLALPDLSPLGPLLDDPAIEKIFHDADYDIRILDRDLGMSVRGLFDTQIAAAFLGERALGLGAIVEKYLGIKLPKAFQRADWAERPLSEGMKDYAATDTVHLPELRDKLLAGLQARGRLEWAQEEFQRRELTRWSESQDEKDAFMRVKGARDLPPRGLAVLRELYNWREDVARERDQATFRVLGNQALIELSVKPPTDETTLASVSGVGEGLLRRRGDEILSAIDRGLTVPDSELPRFPAPKRWDRDPEVEARVERLKAARTRQAEVLDLDPGFLMSRALLEEVARRNPATLDELAEIPDVRRWQVEAIGDVILHTLRLR
jgi:ribonuclease D